MLTVFSLSFVMGGFFSYLAASPFVFQKVYGFREVGTGNKDDFDWNEMVTLELQANPELPENARRAIELDYGLPKDGVLKHQVKKALLFYAVRALHLTQAYRKLPPEERQLALVNQTEIDDILASMDK